MAEPEPGGQSDGRERAAGGCGLPDAELRCVEIDIMNELDLGPADVRARVSDRLLLNALLAAIGVESEQVPVVFSVIDKIDRVSAAATEEKLA